jgi:cytochrome c oxidase assembly protein subunit 15
MGQARIIDAGGRSGARQLGYVRLWLLTVAALVFLLVSVGGATRLTGSGLSITEWQPIVGVVPPLSQDDWQAAFAKYRQTPQYDRVNRGMSLDAFKTIFWWEWTHRFLGRLIGVVFLVPFFYFLAAGQVSRGLLVRLGGIFALGALQGAVGWYMVRSGLADRIDVSQYRLALHLGLAIVIFGALLWTALSLGERPERESATSAAGFGVAAVIVVLMFVQIVLGALVAGLKAGLAHNTWPLMDGRLIPDGLGAMQPWYLNLFENALTVQFNHRVAAYLLLALVLGHTVALFRGGHDPRARRSGLVLMAAALAQTALGVWTLLAHVPLALGLAHQAGAAAVFALAVWHLRNLRHARSDGR